MPGLVRAVADGDGERAALVACHIAMMPDGLAAERSRPPLPFRPGAVADLAVRPVDRASTMSRRLTEHDAISDSTAAVRSPGQSRASSWNLSGTN
jgi:hypothetical protein